VHRSAARFLYRNPAARRVIGSPVGAFVKRALPERYAVALQYHHHVGVFPDLKRPRTLSEKIQHRKLYDRDPRLPLYVDKLAVKDIVADILGPQWVIPTLWSGADPLQLPFDTLQPPYVVKASHACECNYFVLDAAAGDRERIRSLAAEWLALDYGRRYHEWAYSQAPRQLLVEPLIGDGLTLPVDYKLMVFHGTVHHVGVTTGRGTPHKRTDIFDPDWNWLPVSRVSYPERQRLDIPPPKQLAAMLTAATTLAAPFGFARADFYDGAEHPFFGEMTFYPSAGYDPYTPPEYERLLGDLWRL
jgi:teichuronopeptide biosynthesis TupA-like protein